MKNITPLTLLTSLLFLAMPSLAQALNPVYKPAEPASQYLQMDDKARAGFIANYANNLGWMLSPEKPLVVSAEGIQLIKKWVDVYASRVGVADPKTGAEDLNKVFERGVQNAPIINGAFEKLQVLETIGIALAMVETEFQPCPTGKTKGKGMFALTPTATMKAEDLCDVEKGAGAAAKLYKARQAEFGKDGTSAALAIISLARGSVSVKKDFAEIIKEKDTGAQLWATLAKPDPKKFDKAFLEEGINYLPKFFAAAIIAESPEAFGLKGYPLSTYAPVKK